MSTPSVPKALYQANIDLALRIAALLQEHGQQWYDLFADEAGVRLGQGLAGVDRFRRDFSLDALPPLPVDFAGHFDALDAERWQALILASGAVPWLEARIDERRELALQCLDGADIP